MRWAKSHDYAMFSRLGSAQISSEGQKFGQKFRGDRPPFGSWRLRCESWPHERYASHEVGTPERLEALVAANPGDRARASHPIAATGTASPSCSVRRTVPFDPRMRLRDKVAARASDDHVDRFRPATNFHRASLERARTCSL